MKVRLINNMAEAVRDRVRSFLRIEPAQKNTLQIRESLDYESEYVKNKVWYRGDADELSQLYKALNGDCNRDRFWCAVPTPGLSIRKIHTGLPGIIADVLTNIVMADMNEITVDEDMEDTWSKIQNDNRFHEIVSDALTETLVGGDGAFRISLDPAVSQYPIIEFVEGDRCDINTSRGRVTEVVIRTLYNRNGLPYVLLEHYGRGYVRTELTQNGKPVSLKLLPETADLIPEVTYDGDFMMAVPFRIFKSHKWRQRGRSIFTGKTDNFDAFDECWSQWMDALRAGRSKEYIPDNMLPRNPETGEVLKPNAFDHSFLKRDSSMAENSSDKIDVVQPSIPHESYLATYITCLDLCLQGIISPSTLGIDTKKLDNADAQREKEKTTLYTRNKMVDALQNIIPIVVDTVLKVYATANEQPLTDVETEVPFGEYANPSFESQVETVAKGKQGGVMSIEASVEELYGDSKDEEWKEEEVSRLKTEQGIAQVDEMTIDDTFGLPEGVE